MVLYNRAPQSTAELVLVVFRRSRVKPRLGVEESISIEFKHVSAELVSTAFVFGIYYRARVAAILGIYGVGDQAKLRHRVWTWNEGSSVLVNAIAIYSIDQK